MSWLGSARASLKKKSKLNSKLSIGAILELKADAQNLEIVNDISEANEIYTKQWALNAAQVTQLLID